MYSCKSSAKTSNSWTILSERKDESEVLVREDTEE